MTAKSQSIGAITKSVSYGYTNGNLTSLTTPSGQTISYGYSSGRIASITLNGSTTILNQVLYEPFGPVSGWTWGNSTIAARVFDTDGKPTAIDSAGAYTYGYDDAFRVTSVTDLSDSTKSWTYGYDALDRLNSAGRQGRRSATPTTRTATASPRPGRRRRPTQFPRATTALHPFRARRRACTATMPPAIPPVMAPSRSLIETMEG